LAYVVRVSVTSPYSLSFMFVVLNSILRPTIVWNYDAQEHAKLHTGHTLHATSSHLCINMSDGGAVLLAATTRFALANNAWLKFVYINCGIIWMQMLLLLILTKLCLWNSVAY